MKIILIVAILLMAGCSVSPSDIAVSSEKCKNNGGLKNMVVHPNYLDIHCNDSARFEVKRQR